MLICTVKPVAVLVVLPNIGVNAVAGGVTGAEFADGRLMPTAFRAMTLNTYAVPLVSPLTVHERAVGAARSNRVHEVPPLLE